jgi:hypothetical protein
MRVPPWVIGTSIAKQLRSRLGLSKQPKTAVLELLGNAVNRTNNLSDRGPASLTALIARQNGSAHIGAIAVSSRQQRFRACAGTYLAWIADAGEERASTIALTRHQQASRAFAAEMLAPQEVLRERARPHGFTADDIEAEASSLICPYETVLWQAVRAGIELRGDELPVGTRPSLFGAKASSDLFGGRA